MYAYAGNNPVKYTDPDGNFVATVVVVLGFNAGLLGYGIGASRSDEYGFAFRHPIIASQIGKFKHGSTNISTNSVRFSTTLGLSERGGAHKGEGSEVNAVRYSLWSATIASKFGEDISKEAANSHEPDSGLNGIIFNDSLTADSRVDILNNEIGRNIGMNNQGADMKVLTKDVLDYFHDKGMWVTDQQENGTWSIHLEKLSDQKYQTAIDELNKCNSNGFQPGDLQ